MTAMFYVDINDLCQLRCPNCVRGLRLIKNTREVMPLDMFKAVVEKGLSEGYEWVALYNWTEPYLNRKIPEYIRAAKELGALCEISSNLSLPRGYDVIKESLIAGLDRLVVSVSGIEQSVYEIYHIGGDIAVVRDNLERVSQLIREDSLDVRVRLRFLRFYYNEEHEEPLRELAHDLGIFFESATGNGGDPKAYKPPVTERIINDVRNSSPSLVLENERVVCPLVMEQTVLDCRGDAYQCCAFPNMPETKIGNYLELSANELLRARYNHPLCVTCKMPRREMTESDRARLSAAHSHPQGVVPVAAEDEKSAVL